METIPKSSLFYKLLILFVSIVTSFILSNTADLTGAGMGGIYNLYMPLFIGLASIVVFVLANWIHKTFGLIVLILAFLFNVYAGISLHGI